MSKSILYASNTNTQVVTIAGNVLNFGTVVRKYGCNCTLSGGNAEVTGCGYYKVDVNVTMTATAIGEATVTLYKDGVVIPGATGVIDITVADGTGSVVIPAIIKQNCNCTDTITAVITGLAGTVTNATISVIKL